MSDFPSLLPNNASQLQRDIEQVVAGFIADLPVVHIKNVHNPKLCRADFLPWLAWEWSVDEWDGLWSVGTQREVIWNSPNVHRRKGTIWSIRNALAAAGYGDAEVIEDFGNQYHDGIYRRDGSITRDVPDHWAEYRIILKRPITIVQAAQVRRILSKTAPLRSHLRALDFTEALNLHNNTIVRDGSFTRGIA